MPTDFDKLPEQLKSLQLLIEQFRDAEDWDERDEVLADIITHDTDEATAFLRLIADNPDEDVYARCDALCGLVQRTRGAEKKDALLQYLRDPESVYEFCRAADSAATALVTEAAPLLWEAWEKELEEEAVHAAALALEALVPEETARRFTAQLTAQTDVGALDFMRDDVMLKSLARLGNPEVAQALRDWERLLRAKAAAAPDDAADYEDIADLTAEALLRYGERAPTDDDEEDEGA